MGTSIVYMYVIYIEIWSKPHKSKNQVFPNPISKLSHKQAKQAIKLSLFIIPVATAFLKISNVYPQLADVFPSDYLNSGSGFVFHLYSAHLNSHIKNCIPFCPVYIF